MAAAISPDPNIHGKAETITPEQLPTVEWENVALLLWHSALPEDNAASAVRAFVERGGQVIFFPSKDSRSVEFLGTSWQTWAERHGLDVRETIKTAHGMRAIETVRRLKPETADNTDRPRPFRSDDFDFAARLEVPEVGVRVPFALLDPKGDAIGEGELTLSEFGTAAGKVRLNAEATPGVHNLRLRLAGVERIVTTERYVVLYYGGSRAFVVPRRAFESTRALEEFLTLAQRMKQAALGAGSPIAGTLTTDR